MAEGNGPESTWKTHSMDPELYYLSKPWSARFSDLIRIWGSCSRDRKAPIAMGLQTCDPEELQRRGLGSKIHLSLSLLTLNTFLPSTPVCYLPCKPFPLLTSSQREKHRTDKCTATVVTSTH